MLGTPVIAAYSAKGDPGEAYLGKKLAKEPSVDLPPTRNRNNRHDHGTHLVAGLSKLCGSYQRAAAVPDDTLRMQACPS